MHVPQLAVLYEDNHLLAVNKPAGLPTMGTAEGRESLLARAKQYIKARYDKPGEVYLGIVSRLDAPVSGVVLLARTSKAAARLTKQFRTRQVEKIYWALVSGTPEPEAECDDWIKQMARRPVRVVPADTPGAKHARLRYRALLQLPRATWLEIALETGRKHQIRLQLAARELPILGDRKYGSRRSFPHGIALHARRLVIDHPVRHDRLELVAELPAAWREYGVRDD